MGCTYLGGANSLSVAAAADGNVDLYGEKTRAGHGPEQQLFAQRPSMINQAREVFWRGKFLASLIYAHCGPIARCPVDVYAACLS